MTQDAIYQKRDPEEEFFMLSVLALKMIHTEEYDTFDYVYQVNANVFWKEIKANELPFHRWYKWLEDKFIHLRNIDIENKSEFSGDYPIGRSMTLNEEPKFNPMYADNKKKITPRSKGLLSRFFGKKDKKEEEPEEFDL